MKKCAVSALFKIAFEQKEQGDALTWPVQPHCAPLKNDASRLASTIMENHLLIATSEGDGELQLCCHSPQIRAIFMHMASRLRICDNRFAAPFLPNSSG